VFRIEQPGRINADKLHSNCSSEAGNRMKRAMNRLPEQALRDDAEVRAFYQSLGISESTSEAAIAVRRNRPVEQDNKSLVRNKTTSRRSGTNGGR
jgi:hypothetical protein